jgi:2OG-Fe(II) oxygenase superfamily
VRLFLDPDALASLAAKQRKSYAAAQPFPHAVLDGVLPDDALELALDNFPTADSAIWKEYENYHEVKLEAQGEERLGDATSLLLYQFNSAPFLRFLEVLTGIGPLMPDPYFEGGGLHQIARGGKLGIHADFSRHWKLQLQRRLNVIVYLNRDWEDEYGGHLELWDADTMRCAKKIAPLYNRMVVFTITDRALHGHPEPLACPPDRTRKSIALYYFTVDTPDDQTGETEHSTIFVQRPGEVLASDVALSREDGTSVKRDRFKTATAAGRRKQFVRRITPPVLFDAVRGLRKRR